MSVDRDAIHIECMQVLDRFMDALNEHNAQGMDAAMHFPHLRLADGRFKVYEVAGDNPMDIFSRLKADDDWKYSHWGRRELVQCNGTKAHYLLSYTRYRTDDSTIGTYESLYVLTFKDERWGIQARSSFGP
jgi:hypothetical protein